MRLLDLLRLLQGRRQSDRPPQAALGAELGRAGMGLGLAAQPAYSLQPRVGRSRREAVVASARRTSGGTKRSRSGPGTTSPTSCTNRLPTGRPKMRAARKPSRASIRSSCNRTARDGSTFRSGLQDGPLPTHYEPQESIIKNPLYGQQCNPSRMEWMRDKDNPYHQPYDDPRFPYILTTYRLTEHHTAGGMSRWLSWLSELQPEAFCEVSPELAARHRAEERRLGDPPHRARRNRSARAGDQPPSAAAAERPDRAPDRHAVSLVEQGPGARRLPQRAVPVRCRPQRGDHGNESDLGR